MWLHHAAKDSETHINTRHVFVRLVPAHQYSTWLSLEVMIMSRFSRLTEYMDMEYYFVSHTQYNVKNNKQMGQ